MQFTVSFAILRDEMISKDTSTIHTYTNNVSDTLDMLQYLLMSIYEQYKWPIGGEHGS